MKIEDTQAYLCNKLQFTLVPKINKKCNKKKSIKIVILFILIQNFQNHPIYYMVNDHIHGLKVVTHFSDDENVISSKACIVKDINQTCTMRKNKSQNKKKEGHQKQKMGMEFKLITLEV